MTKMKQRPKHYYVLCPEDDAQEFLDLFKELYPTQNVHLAVGIYVPITSEGKPQDSTTLETFRVIVRDRK